MQKVGRVALALARPSALADPLCWVGGSQRVSSGQFEILSINCAMTSHANLGRAGHRRPSGKHDAILGYPNFSPFRCQELLGEKRQPRQCSPLNPPSVGCAEGVDERGEKPRIRIIWAADRLIPVQLYKFGSNAASLGIAIHGGLLFEVTHHFKRRKGLPFDLAHNHIASGAFRPHFATGPCLLCFFCLADLSFELTLVPRRCAAVTPFLE
jgi:hypothetical protein